jgi:predicted O-methyltransferase YrrM
MRILDERVEGYLHDLRPARSEVMADMEEVARRDSVPIVHWETGRFLATLCRALDPNVLEVGTAIGYSTLHLAEALSAGRVTTLEIDPERAGQAREFWARAGVAERIELVEGDARETIPELSGSFDLLFVDAAKGQYREYIELAEPLLAERALLVIDNLLVGGEVALPEGAEGRRSPESIASARALNPQLMGSQRWLGSVLPIGDGVGFAARL